MQNRRPCYQATKIEAINRCISSSPVGKATGAALKKQKQNPEQEASIALTRYAMQKAHPFTRICSCSPIPTRVISKKVRIFSEPYHELHTQASK